MTPPYIATSPEYVKWAKEGERNGEPFIQLIDEVCDMAEDVHWKVYDNGREKLKDTFDLHHECDCD